PTTESPPLSYTTLFRSLAAAGLDLHLDRDHARRLADHARHRRDAVLLDGAHRVRGRADLPGLIEAREDRVHVRLAHRELRGPERSEEHTSELQSRVDLV